MKSALLSKIASQAANFYSQPVTPMAKDAVKGLWEKEWVATVNGKSMGYSAMAQFHQAEVDGENHKVGEQLSRLTEAIRLSEQCNRYSIFFLIVNYRTF